MGDTRYFDAAGFAGKTVGLTASVKTSAPKALRHLGLRLGTRRLMGRPVGEYLPRFQQGLHAGEHTRPAAGNTNCAISEPGLS